MSFCANIKNLEKKYIPEAIKNIAENIYAIGDKKICLNSFFNIIIVLFLHYLNCFLLNNNY